jgi:hypothetical protein
MKHKHIKKRRKAYIILLGLPPLLALGMIGVISFTNKVLIVVPEGLMLSPVKDASPLILSLSIFIVGYIIFIGLLFKDNIEKFIFKKYLHKKY